MGLFEILRIAPFCIRIVTISIFKFQWHNLVKVNEVIHEIGTIFVEKFTNFDFAISYGRMYWCSKEDLMNWFFRLYALKFWPRRRSIVVWRHFL